MSLRIVTLLLVLTHIFSGLHGGILLKVAMLVHLILFFAILADRPVLIAGWLANVQNVVQSIFFASLSLISP